MRLTQFLLFQGWAFSTRKARHTLTPEDKKGPQSVLADGSEGTLNDLGTEDGQPSFIHEAPHDNPRKFSAGAQRHRGVAREDATNRGMFKKLHAFQSLIQRSQEVVEGQRRYLYPADCVMHGYDVNPFGPAIQHLSHTKTRLHPHAEKGLAQYCKTYVRTETNGLKHLYSMLDETELPVLSELRAKVGQRISAHRSLHKTTPIVTQRNANYDSNNNLVIPALNDDYTNTPAYRKINNAFMNRTGLGADYKTVSGNAWNTWKFPINNTIAQFWGAWKSIGSINADFITNYAVPADRPNSGLILAVCLGVLAIILLVVALVVFIRKDVIDEHQNQDSSEKFPFPDSTMPVGSQPD